MKNIHSILALLIFISCNQVTKETETTISEKPKEAETELAEKVNFTKSSKTYEIGNIKVKLTQIKSDGTNFYCKSKLVTSKDNNIIDSISFTPEPVGEDYGISKPIDGIDEPWFENEEEQKKAYLTAEYKAVVEDEPNLFEMNSHFVHPIMTKKVVHVK